MLKNEEYNRITSIILLMCMLFTFGLSINIPFDKVYAETASNSITLNPPTVSASVDPIDNDFYINYDGVVKIKQNGANIAYSLDDGEFKYVVDEVVSLILYRDTKLKVKSWLEEYDPNIEYNIPIEEYNLFFSGLLPEPPPTSTPTTKIVKAPTADIPSGEVPYGQKITMQSSDTTFFLYKINDGEFQTSYVSTATITITEDTQLTLRAVKDAFYPGGNITYIYEKNVYNYTIFPHRIDSISLLDKDGNALENKRISDSFTAEVEVFDVTPKADTISLAFYDENKALITVVNKALRDDAESYTSQKYSFNVEPNGKTVAYIKAFVWDDYNNMKPVAKNVTLELGK